MKYIFDLDNTLVFTDTANNAAYNKALIQMNLPPIHQSERITREIVFKKYPELSGQEKNYLVNLKQKFFSPGETTINEDLCRVVKSLNKQDCVLWSRAEMNRAERILQYYGMRELFCEVVFSPKMRIADEINWLCRKFTCSRKNLVFYEDNSEIADQIKAMGCCCVLIR